MLPTQILVILKILFWISVVLIFHSYILYPLLLSHFASGKSENRIIYKTKDLMPRISIIIPAFNEAEVIEEKIESIYQTTYPLDRIEVLVGSDASTDRTNEILHSFTQKYNNLRFFQFTNRQGKAKVNHKLIQQAEGEVLILTDANVMYDKDTLYELIKHFKNPEIGLVDTHMINKGLKREGISMQESAYISREVKMKNHESLIWGTMMGPFGGCFAIRRELYKQVPATCLVEDFYINMKVLEKGKKAINNLSAKVYEDVSNNLLVEFRRKIRIATGNFQNLGTFGYMLFNFIAYRIPLDGLSFCFFSHKVARWFGPFLLIFILSTGAVLSNTSLFYYWITMVYLATLLLPFLDALLRSIGIHLKILRFITHFYSMNLALLLGFLRYIKGVKTNIWQPTKRNQ